MIEETFDVARYMHMWDKKVGLFKRVSRRVARIVRGIDVYATCAHHMGRGSFTEYRARVPYTMNTARTYEEVEATLGNAFGRATATRTRAVWHVVDGEASVDVSLMWDTDDVGRSVLCARVAHTYGQER